MKRYTAMTDEELKALGQDQCALNNTIDLECAVEGVALPPDCPNEPDKPIAEPDTIFYSVRFDVMLDNQEDADKVKSIIDELCLRSYRTTYASGSYEHHGPMSADLESDPGSVVITRNKLWSQAHYAKHRDELARYVRAMSEYDDDHKSFAHARDERKELEDKVLKEVKRATEALDVTIKIKRDFDRYVELAGGDKVVALRFYMNAHKDHDESELRELLGVTEAVQTPSPPNRVAVTALGDDEMPF